MEINDISHEKILVRKKILKERNRLFPLDIKDYSEIICKCICSESRFLRAKDILLYYNYGSEVKTDYIFNKSLEMGKNVYFPKVEGDEIDFYKVTSKQDFTDGFKGILEPYGTNYSFKSEYNDCIIIVPGSVFGRDGYRMGYGRGFYDRFLKRYKNLYKIGICFNIQLLDTCPHDENDVMMNEIITEKEILTDDGNGEVRWI